MVTVSKTVKVRPQQDCGYLERVLGEGSQQKMMTDIQENKITACPLQTKLCSNKEHHRFNAAAQQQNKGLQNYTPSV